METVVLDWRKVKIWFMGRVITCLREGMVKGRTGGKKGAYLACCLAVNERGKG